jgi:inner membrane transporter RhtA
MMSGALEGVPHWPVLVTVTAVALMSSVIPHSLELVSLRRLPPATFAVLTSLSPVLAAVIGWAVLGQQLNAFHYLAIVLVTAASIGAVTSGAPRPTRTRLDAPTDMGDIEQEGAVAP